MKREDYIKQLEEKNKELQEVIEANRIANEEIHIRNIKLKNQNEEYLAINDEIKSQNKELRKAKQKIEEAYKYWETTFNSIKSSILLINKDGEILQCNTATTQLLQKPKKDIIGKTFWQSAYNTNNPAENDPITKMHNSLKRETGILQYKNKWIEITVDPTIEKQKKLTGAILTIDDITARIETENEIAESRERFQSFMETATDLINMCDETQRLIFVNKSMCNTLEYKKEELIGQHISFLFKPGEKEKRFNDKMNAELLANGKLSYETIWLTKSGKEIHGELKVVARFNKNNEYIGCHAVFHNITDRISALEKLKESEQRYKSLYNNATIGLYRTTPEGKILMANPALLKILKFDSFKELSKRNLETTGYLDKKDRIDFKKEIEAKGKISDKESVWKAKDNTLIYIKESAKAVKDKTGKIIYYEGTVEDITKRKEAENKLKESEEKYRALVENSHDGIYIYRGNRFLFVNTTIIKILGYSEDELHNMSIWEIIHPEDRKRIMQIGEKRARGEKVSSSYTAKVVCKNKEIKDAEFSVRIIRYQGDYAVLGTVRDITERKKAEEALKNSEQRFRSMAELLPQTVFESDLKGNATMINDNGYKMFGYSKSEMKGKTLNIFNYIAPEDHKKLSYNLRNKLSTKNNIAQEYTGLKKDGTKFPIAVYTSIIYKSKKPVGLRGIIIDLTEQEQQKEKIKEINRKLNTLISNLDGMVYQCLNDRFWTMLFVSNGCENLTGYKPGELLNNSEISYEDIIVDEDKDKVRNSVEEALNNKTPFNIVYKIKTKDKIIKTVWEKGQGIYSRGKLIHIEGYIVDITERVKTEETLKQRNEELEIARRKAEESDKLKSAFLANMSHEIRTPMNGVIGFAELLGEPDLSQEERDEYLKIIQNSSNQLLGIINDIIDISKIETGIIDIFEEKVYINDLLAEQYEFFQSPVKEKNLELILKTGLDDEESYIYTDEVKLKQIITNLISNSIKFTDKGKIIFGYELKEDHLEFYVSDTGIGIEKEQQDIIFQPFRQIEETSARRYGGTGLGLHISKAYVEKMGGSVFLESIPGQGSTFFFTIPYKPVDKKHLLARKKDFDNKDIEWHNNTILVAEDEEMNFFFLKRILAKSGINIIHAANGKEAVDAFRKASDKIDIILMDIKMPEMSGYDATKEIRKLNKEIPIIIQTAFALSDDKEKAMAAGCNDYIAKPINKKLLLEKIGYFLNK